MTIKEFILNDPELKKLSEEGNDSGIANTLNAVSPEILVDNEMLEPNYVVALAVATYVAAFQSGNQPLIVFWSVLVTASTGFTAPVKANDPNLVAQLSLAKGQGLLKDKQINHYAKRFGSIAEREWQRFVTVDEISELFAEERRPQEELV